MVAKREGQRGKLSMRKQYYKPAKGTESIRVKGIGGLYYPRDSSLWTKDEARKHTMQATQPYHKKKREDIADLTNDAIN